MLAGRRIGGAASIALLIALAGCSKAPEGGAAKDLAEAPAAPAGGQAPIKVAVPQIAYTYAYGFDVPFKAIATVQDRHIALCDRLGPAACRIVEMQRAMREAEDSAASLKLVVRADLARSFGRALAGAVGQVGGTQADSSIAAEDLSKQIVDTEARLRARLALSDRLMELLRTRSGPVADLVAAERSVAEVQEEIDAARSWLAEARGRVAMSTFDIRYEADGGGLGFAAPLRQSFATMASVTGQSLAMLIQLVALLLPWLALGGATLWGVRRWRRWRQSRPVAPQDETA